ncbi:D-TA family PLP-dependent enzyme [Pedobacter sp. SYP-B3415]|uniref:D-TA family PLP-dependent enzyme n=1 Tax=Pedobacter sp. SYP-B3415 TaxID=2496641 RepID=UPI00101D92D6|nr:D-TA family PLP-dependent enzyme [Pedobacter sp. SYP-B3415]
MSLKIPRALTIDEAEALETPCLVVFPELVQANIDLLIQMAGGTHRLMPHVKTCKSAHAVRLMLKAGLNRFKCATIAEAEMLGMEGAAEVLLAYQPVGANIFRLAELIGSYPNTRFACLVDHPAVADRLNSTAAAHGLVFDLYIDLDVGMHRTGIAVQEAGGLASVILGRDKLRLRGLHAYDGHIHQLELDIRRSLWEEAFRPVFSLADELEEKTGTALELVAGGTPTFLLHLESNRVTCSPGTFIYWDAGYQEQYPEQAFQPAAWLLGRVISVPGPGRLCLDPGHKAVASEMPLAQRLRFPFDPSFSITGHSEEHLIIGSALAGSYKPGDLIYALPWHICPTVALHEEAVTIVAGKKTGTWPATARKRKINI